MLNITKLEINVICYMKVVTAIKVNNFLYQAKMHDSK